MSHGYSFDVAFGVDEVWCQAACIVLAEFECGKPFDWHSWTFPE